MSRRAKVRRVITLLERELGIPRQSSELPPPMDVLIATTLSQNTNDKNSQRAYTGLRARFKTWADVATAPRKSIGAAIRSGGMARQKSARIKSMLEEVRKGSGSYSLELIRNLTDDEIIELLTRFHGVGPKTASCVLLFSLGRDVFPVDTHVHRLCSRLGLAEGARTPEETFERMAEVIPKGKAYSFHTNLIRFGRMVCRSTSPHCDRCAMFALCAYEGKSKGTRTVTSKADHHFMLLDNVNA